MQKFLELANINCYKDVMGLINKENWSHSYYKSLNLKSFVSLGAVPPPVVPLSIPGIKFVYCVTVTDSEEEICQKDFEDLDAACNFINEHYGHWQFTDMAQGGEGGCSSCEAH